MPISPPSIFSQIRKRKRTILLLTLATPILVFLALNIIAYRQAWTMTHFVQGGERTSPPEALTLFQKIKIVFVGIRVTRPTNSATPADIPLPFETFRFGGQNHDDCEAWFIPAQNPKGLCIGFHPYSSSKSSLLGLAKAFHGLDYDVLLVDFRGSGGSRGNDTTHGYREAEDVAAAVDFASHKWPGEPVILDGQSMGGAAVLRAIADLNVHPSAAIIESTYDRMLSIEDNRLHAMGLPAFPLARLLVFWMGRQFGYNAFDQNPADYATRIHCPVLIMQGGLDRRVTNAEARNLFDHLAGPGQFEIFDNAGHCGFLHVDPKRWNDNVTQFLANVSAQKSGGS
jgi:alpha-beta hydrolase superfamily lysophospholipase